MILKKIINVIFEEITSLGGIFFYLLVAFFFLFLNQIFYFTVLICTVFLMYLLTFLIRAIYFKNRPKKQEYKSFIEKIDSSSFPSLHSMRITFLFLILSFKFTNNILIITFFFAITLLVYYSRIYLKKHYYTDVLGGIVFGIMFYFLFLIIKYKLF
jgi:membrane-associated phospholipid phosphatase